MDNVSTVGTAVTGGKGTPVFTEKESTEKEFAEKEFAEKEFAENENPEEGDPDSVLDIRNRLQNLMWTVGKDYDLSMALWGDAGAGREAFLKTYRKSPHMACYEAVCRGAFASRFDEQEFRRYLNRKIYAGATLPVLLCFSRMCIDSALWKPLVKERPGVENLRRRGFLEILEKDAACFTHTDWEMIEGRYLAEQSGEALNGGQLPAPQTASPQTAPSRMASLQTALAAPDNAPDGQDARVRSILDRIASLQNASTLREITDGIDAVYVLAYPKDFAGFFKAGTDTQTPAGPDRQKTAASDAPEDDGTNPLLSLFFDPVSGEDDRKRTSLPRRILLDPDSAAQAVRYVERNYGKSCLTPQEQERLNARLCRGIHKDCRLHITEGLLHSASPKEMTGKAEYVQAVAETNRRLYEDTKLVTRQNILTLADTLKRALLLRSDTEYTASDCGTICTGKLWQVGRTKNRRLFQKIFRRDAADFAVDILMDASGSQQKRQGFVALQGYILSQALGLVKIPHRVVSFCTFGSHTILQRFRDYDDAPEMDLRLFEFYGSANNRDGLAIRAVAEDLLARPEENKILILLSDGRPNDIIAESSKKPETPIYASDYAVKDTALEIRKLRNQRVAVLGVFAGEEEDLEAEKKIFGKDFAYIRDIGRFAAVVGKYLIAEIGKI